MENCSGLTALSDFDDEDTTDMSDGGHSDTDGSAGLTASACGSSARVSGAGRRCRFGGTVLETIPATPVSATVCSPPGLSRAAMRRERDQYKSDAIPAAFDGEKLYDLSANKSELGLSNLMSGRQCRFGSSRLGLNTVPKTPIGAGSYKTLLTSAIGSPPGLSHASLRQERDACNANALSGKSWGSRHPSAFALSLSALTTSQGGGPMTPPAMRSAKKQAAREASLQLAKQGAALLQVSLSFCTVADEQASRHSASSAEVCHSFVARTSAQKETDAALAHDVDDSHQTTEMGHGSSSEAENSLDSSVAEGQRCCFAGASLRTVPVVVGVGSPPGLSRAALRQARDACMAEGFQANSWGGCHVLVEPPCTSTSLLTIPVTIGLNGKALTQPAMRSANLRSARDESLVLAR